MSKNATFTVTKEQQILELTNRIPPILNVDIIVHKDNKYLIGFRESLVNYPGKKHFLFPGGRVRYDETPQQAAERILARELPGVKAILRKLITAVSGIGYDTRANGVTLYYLLDYLSGVPLQNDEFQSYEWFSLEELIENPLLYPLDYHVLSEIKQAVLLMNTNEDEQLIEVDHMDQDIGIINKRVAHVTPERCHRSALIIVYNTHGELILHQRSQYKTTGALKWDVFGGHQPVGLTIQQTAEHELVEELGITTPVKFMKKYEYHDNTQCEFQYVYATVSDGPYAYDRNEVAQIRAFNVSRLVRGEYDQEFEILSHVKKFVADNTQQSL